MKLNFMHKLFIYSIIRLEIRWRTRAGYCFNTSCVLLQVAKGFVSIKNRQKGMRKLLKSFKTEINPTEAQKVRIRKTIGTCRFIYNFYLAHNKGLHESGKKFMSSCQFRVWLNNEFLPSHPEYSWIKEVYSKSITQACLLYTSPSPRD